MPSACPSSWVVVSARHSSSPGADGSVLRIDVDPDREAELGVIGGNVEIGRAGAFGRQGAVQADACELARPAPAPARTITSAVAESLTTSRGELALRQPSAPCGEAGGHVAGRSAASSTQIRTGSRFWGQ